MVVLFGCNANISAVQQYMPNFSWGCFHVYVPVVSMRPIMQLHQLSLHKSCCCLMLLLITS
jgi:hypothetical protein